VLGGLSNPSLGGGDPATPSAPGEQSSSPRASFGYFGFSSSLDTAARGRPDDTLVMRVRSSAPDFWRGQTFDQWNGRSWSVTSERERAIGGSQPIRVPPATDDGPAFRTVGSDELVQTYYVEKSGPNMIFAAATPTRVYIPERSIFQLSDGSLRAGVHLDDGTVYTVVSRRRLVTPDALRASDATAIPPSFVTKYATEDDVTPRVAELAKRVTAPYANTYDKVRALERWMGAHTRYTLDIPPLPRGADAVDQFLFVDRKGFCEQIGTSLVVMLRSLGIPARLVVGYTSGERNPFTGLYEVRAKNAHAWAEVYFPGVGWQGFDPTASVPLAGDSAVASAGSGSLSYLSSRISVPGWAGIAVAVAGGLAVLAAVVIRLRRRGRRTRAAGERSWAGARLARLERIGRRAGRARGPGETAREYALALTTPEDDRPLDVVEVLDRAMYSGTEVTPDEQARVDRTLDALASDRRRRSLEKV
jgi:transglutaminase-like putative cysteine protease